MKQHSLSAPNIVIIVYCIFIIIPILLSEGKSEWGSWRMWLTLNTKPPLVFPCHTESALRRCLMESTIIVQRPVSSLHRGMLTQMQRLRCNLGTLGRGVSSLLGDTQGMPQEYSCDNHWYKGNASKSERTYNRPPVGRRLTSFVIAYALGYVGMFWGLSNLSRGRRCRGWIIMVLFCLNTLCFTWLFLLTVASWTWDWWW
jgi:hypothetical protein